jgi:hypothetical protein
MTVDVLEGPTMFSSEETWDLQRATPEHHRQCQHKAHRREHVEDRAVLNLKRQGDATQPSGIVCEVVSPFVDGVPDDIASKRNLFVH